MVGIDVVWKIPCVNSQRRASRLEPSIIHSKDNVNEEGSQTKTHKTHSPGKIQSRVSIFC